MFPLVDIPARSVPGGRRGVNQLSWEIGDENSSWPPKVFRLNRISWTFLGFLSPISQVSPLFLLHSYYSSHFATYGKVKPKISARIYVYDFFALPVCAHEKLRKKTGILDWGGGGREKLDMWAEYWPVNASFMNITETAYNLIDLLIIIFAPTAPPALE